MREPLWLASIGNGPRHVLVIAGAHANEPVGSHTVLALARYLVAEPALADGLTWHLLPVWDPPLLPQRYYQGFYRPVARNQPGFTFPISGAEQDDVQPLPETWAVMHVIDQARPELVVDLHNGDFGGQAWFILNRKQEGLASRLRSAAAVGGLALTEAVSRRRPHPHRRRTLRRCQDTRRHSGAGRR